MIIKQWGDQTPSTNTHNSILCETSNEREIGHGRTIEILIKVCKPSSGLVSYRNLTVVHKAFKIRELNILHFTSNFVSVKSLQEQEKVIKAG